MHNGDDSGTTPAAPVAKQEAPPKYEYTGKARTERQRKALADAGGSRVEAHLDADELAKLDALAGARFQGSRRAALKCLVQQLPAPKKKGYTVTGDGMIS